MSNYFQKFFNRIDENYIIDKYVALLLTMPTEEIDALEGRKDFGWGWIHKDSDTAGGEPILNLTHDEAFADWCEEAYNYIELHYGSDVCEACIHSGDTFDTNWRALMNWISKESYAPHFFEVLDNGKVKIIR